MAFQKTKQKWSRSCDPPPFWFQRLHILTVFYLLQLKLLLWGWGRGSWEVQGIQNFGHGFRKVRNAWPRRIMRGLPAPPGSTANLQLPQHSCCRASEGRVRADTLSDLWRPELPAGVISMKEGMSSSLGDGPERSGPQTALSTTQGVGPKHQSDTAKAP